jgi:hypothetical protein
MNCRGDVRHGRRELWVLEIELLVGAGKAEIHPARLDAECAMETRRDRIAGDARRRPRKVAVGEHRDDPIGILVLEPIRDLLAHPPRIGSLGGEEENEPARLIERIGDRGPQMRIRAQRRLVTEDTQCPAFPPRLGKPLQPSLQTWCQQIVCRVRIRHEAVVNRISRRLPLSL